MENVNQAYSPRRYDEERLRLFHTRATHGTNFPRVYRPNPEVVNLEAFADAIIGGYGDLTDHVHPKGGVRHSANMGRLAFAISFLEGAPLEYLNERLQGDKLAKKKGVREFALGVAGEGARYLKDTVLLDGVAPSREIGPTETYESVSDFVDLGDAIKRLYSEERVPAGKAQALLLLFGLAESAAPETAKRRAIEQVCQELKPRLRTAIVHQPHHGEKLIDQTFAKGATYLKAILGSPFSSSGAGTMIEQLVDFEMANYDDSAQRLACREQVYGHIGYVLGKLYPER